MKPVPVKREVLVRILRDMANKVEIGDCFDGSIEYYYWDEENGAGQNEYSVMGCYRTGNLEGQGGVILIGCSTTDENYDRKYDEQRDA